jgi:hypothetical protein
MNQYIYNKKVILILIFSTLLGINACNDLEENVYSDETTVNYYQNADQVMAAYLAPYTFLQNAVFEIHWSLLAFSTDEAAATVKVGESWEWNDAPRWTQLHQHTWTSSLDWILWEWFQIWQGIGYANHFITEMEGRDVSNYNLPISQEQMIAEIKMVRAYLYTMAMDVFGNVPIVVSLGVPNPPTRPRAEVFEFIETEILENIDMLGEKNHGNWYGKFTQSAAYTMLARLYLNAEVYTGTPRWEDAIAAADVVLNSGVYELDPTWDAPFYIQNQFSNENIFVIPYDVNNARGFNIATQALPGAMKDAFDFQDYPWGKMVTQESFFRLFSENDFRINQWLVGPQSYIDENGEEQPVEGWYDQDGQQLVIKPEIQMFNNPNQAYGEGVRNIKYEIEKGQGLNNNNDLVVFRLAEVMFIKAEALMRLNGGNATQEAVNLINQVRARSFAEGDPDATYTTATLTMDELLDERAREFSWEMKRREDLIRFGKFTDAWWEKPASAEHRTLFPIPLPILTANPALEQNPGY